ncbi:MAG TPA: nucleotide-binding protein [Candidatus Angelobacter sp.]
MNQDPIRLSDYNYDATQFIERVRSLFERDRYFLGPIVQRSALIRTPSGELQHAITKIDVTLQGQPNAQPEALDYGTVLFVRDVYDENGLLTRLSSLRNKTFTAGQHTITSNGIGFSDRYEASRNSYSDWPCTVFDASFNTPQISFEPLLHPILKSFASPFEAVRELLAFKQFNDSSDGRIGHIILCIPNMSARLDKLVLADHCLQVTMSGRIQPSAFKLDVNYKTPTESRSIEKSLNDHCTDFDLSFIPSELRLWLIAKQGFIADFHEENEYYSVGGNPVLTKKIAVNPAFAPEGEPELFSQTPLETLEPVASSRVFIIHGHNTSAKESVARFLEKLGLEAIILHEQANLGDTIIEKFQLHSDVAFAVALLTGDDEGREAATKGVLKRRARQNAILELGYFMGKLGRKRVCALVEDGVEIPSDYHGVVFIPLDAAGRWKFDLVRELKEAGLDVDANRAL